MASRLVSWAVSWIKKGGMKQQDQESQNEEKLPSSSVDISSDRNTCLESVIETHERLSQISCSKHPLQAVPRTVTIPEPSIDGEEEWYDCAELCQGSCSEEAPEQGEREMGTQLKQECETFHDTQQSDQQLAASKLPRGDHNAPSLVELVSLPVTDWHSLGLQLGVTYHRLKAIQANNAQYPDSLERCVADMFETWLNSDHEPSYEKIGKALCAVGIPELAQQFCRQHGIVLEMYQPPTVITQYAEHLRRQYLCQSVCPDSDWPPLIGEQYTELALIEHERQLEGEEYAQFIAENRAHGKIDHIVAERKETELADMLMSSSEHCNQVRVLIDGTPGVGKTTLCRKISRDWANGKLLKEYDVVLLLHLRDNRIAKARSLEDIFFHPDPVLRADVVAHILRSGGKNVLLILDGLDELSHRDRTEDSLFLDLIHKKVLPNCSLIITSRPYASESLVQLKCLDRHVEVLGFTEKQIVKCIRDSIKDEDEAAKLVEALQERQDIMDMCYVPLFCAIAMYIFTRKFVLPGTMTELLSLFLLNSVNRHLKLQKSRLEVRNLFNLPGPLAQDFDCLCELAFVNLMENKLMFTYEELRQAFPHCEREDVEFHTLGLLTAVKSFTLFSEETSYQFLHLTVQEYLAARHIATKLSPDEQVRFFKQHLKCPQIRTTLVFLAGLTGLSSSGFLRVFEQQEVACAAHAFLFIIHCIYEAQNPHLCSTLANGMQQYVINLQGIATLTLFQSKMLAYFLASSGCSWKALHFPKRGLNVCLLEAFRKCSNIVHVQGSQVEAVSFHSFQTWPPESSFAGNALEVIGTTVLFRHLRTLKIALGQCDNVGSICNGLHLLRDLQTLELAFSVPSSHVFSNLMDELQNKRALQHLHLDKWVDDEAAKHLSNMVKGNHTLQTLELSHCNLTAAGSHMLFEAIKVNCNLTCLDISGSDSLLELGYEPLLPELNPALEALEDMLRWNHTLARLRLYNSVVSGIAVEYIAAGLVRNQGLKSLDIMWKISFPAKGCIGTLAAVNLLKVLQINNSLEELRFSYTADLETGCSEVLSDSFEKMLAQNTVLHDLRLKPVMFSKSNSGWLLAAKGIASGLRRNSSLTHLSVENDISAWIPPCFLGDTLTQLLKAVSNHPSLTILSIWTGNLRNEHIRGILGVLSSSNTLLSLTIQTNTDTSNVLPSFHKLAAVAIDCSIPQHEKGIITCNGRKICFEFELCHHVILYKILSFQM